MDENQHLDQSFDSSSSTLTHCADLGTTDSDCDSDINNFNSHKPCILNLSESEVCKHLSFARHRRPPYDQYTSWSNINLWHEIAKNIFDENPYVNKPSLPDILSVVQQYYNIYTVDPSLSRMKDESFKNAIHFVFGRCVFGPLSDQKGSITFEDIEEVQIACSETCIEIEDLSVRQALQEGQKEMQPILPSTSDVREMEKLKRELGYSGILSVQYAEDLQLLPLKDAQKQWLVIHYGPTSDKYLTIAGEDHEFRRNVLLGISLEGKPSSNWSSSSIGSHKRRKKWE